MRRLLLIAALMSFAVSAYAQVHCRRIAVTDCRDKYCLCDLLTQEECEGGAGGFSWATCTANQTTHWISNIWDPDGRDRRIEISDPNGCGHVRRVHVNTIACQWNDTFNFCECEKLPTLADWIDFEEEGCARFVYPLPCTN